MTKKLLKFLTIALVAGACTCSWAVDYNNHFYNQRVYRVAIGSGTAPSAADMAGVAIRNGDMVLNTDDDCLYIMHATNVYTKMTSEGAVTLASMTVPLASNKVFVGNASGVANEKTISGFFSITTGGVASATTTGLSVTNATVSGAALSGVGVVVTNVATATTVDALGDVIPAFLPSVTNATVGGAALSGVGVVVTNVATATTITALTNATIAVTLTSQYGDLVYLDAGSNVVTNSIMTNCVVDSADITLYVADAIATLTVESGIPAVSSPTIALETGDFISGITSNVVTPINTLTVENGTPAVSAPTISLETDTFAKP
jgi:hypothetical protein